MDDRVSVHILILKSHLERSLCHCFPDCYYSVWPDFFAFGMQSGDRGSAQGWSSDRSRNAGILSLTINWLIQFTLRWRGSTPSGTGRGSCQLENPSSGHPVIWTLWAIQLCQILWRPKERTGFQLPADSSRSPLLRSASVPPREKKVAVGFWCDPADLARSADQKILGKEKTTVFISVLSGVNSCRRTGLGGFAAEYRWKIPGTSSELINFATQMGAESVRCSGWFRKAFRHQAPGKLYSADIGWRVNLTWACINTLMWSQRATAAGCSALILRLGSGTPDCLLCAISGVVEIKDGNMAAPSCNSKLRRQVKATTNITVTPRCFSTLLTIRVNSWGD